jgi:transcriptional regulator with XRE-family HTH domain
MEKFHRSLTIPANRRVISEHALLADDSCISVAGLAIKVGQFATSGAAAEPQSVQRNLSGVGANAIARLVQLARREEGLTPEKYAMRIGIGLDELVMTESGTRVPEPRVLHALSEALRISYQKLMSMAGHITDSNQQFEQEVLRFAASSGPMDKLSKDESKSLHDLLKLLHD